MVRLFKMIRKNDTSGVSGTGHVLTGVVFDDGQTIVKWLSKTSSIGIWKSFDDFLAVHVTSHPENKTEIVWGEPW
jgi:hypothetical protein